MSLELRMLKTEQVLGWLAQPARVQPARVRFVGIATCVFHRGLPLIISVLSRVEPQREYVVPVIYGAMDGPATLTKNVM
jgi:hypothetical protein